MPGWFDLRTPQDLLAKLRVDCQRVLDEPADSYAAFDFFVTAWHIADWKYQGDYVGRRALIDQNPILAICEHVANGLKHFQLNNAKLNSVSDAGVTGTFGRTFSMAFDRTRVVLTLEGRARSEFGATISVYDLAPKVVEFWERELAVEPK